MTTDKPIQKIPKRQSLFIERTVVVKFYVIRLVGYY